jgi:hypothetical protein
MWTIRRTAQRTARRLACLAAMAAALTGGAAALLAAPASATLVPPPGRGDTGPSTVTVHTVTVGGTPGWQIALLAIGAAALAAIIAVLAGRMRSARRREVAAGTR